LQDDAERTALSLFLAGIENETGAPIGHHRTGPRLNFQTLTRQGSMAMGFKASENHKRAVSLKGRDGTERAAGGSPPAPRGGRDVERPRPILQRQYGHDFEAQDMSAVLAA
jgi:hypothetical protein